MTPRDDRASGSAGFRDVPFRVARFPAADDSRRERPAIRAASSAQQRKRKSAVDSFKRHSAADAYSIAPETCGTESRTYPRPETSRNAAPLPPATTRGRARREVHRNDAPRRHLRLRPPGRSALTVALIVAGR